MSCSTVALEQRVVIDKDIVGILETPKDQIKGPMVLILHGFMGNKNDLMIANTNEGVLERAASALASEGIASLRIDFRGAGESGGEFKNTTFTGQINDANISLEWLRRNTTYQVESLGILGWSQGGLVASHVVNDNKDIKAAALWTPVTHPYMTYSKLLGSALIDKAIASPESSVFRYTTEWGVTAELKASFFKEMVNTQPLAAISQYDRPLLVIMGKKDDLVVNGSGDAWVRYHPGKTQLKEFDTDHVWSAFSGPNE